MDQRLCFHCNGLVEDELHAIVVCPLYQDIRDTLFAVARDLDADFDTFSEADKLLFYNVQQRFSTFNCQNLQ